MNFQTLFSTIKTGLNFDITSGSIARFAARRGLNISENVGDANRFTSFLRKQFSSSAENSNNDPFSFPKVGKILSRFDETGQPTTPFSQILYRLLSNSNEQKLFYLKPKTAWIPDGFMSKVWFLAEGANINIFGSLYGKIEGVRNLVKYLKKGDM